MHVFSCTEYNLGIYTAYKAVMLTQLRRRVVITGMGIASPLGCGVSHVWKKLLAGESGITRLPQTDEFKKIPCKIAGVVPVHELNIDKCLTPAEARTMSKDSIHAIAVTEQALKDANWWPHLQTEESRFRTGVNIANVGTEMVFMISQNYDYVRAGDIRKIKPHFIPMCLPNLGAGNVSIHFKLQGPNLCIASACAAASHAIGVSTNTISRGDADVMVTGGVELMLHPLILAGLTRAKALCTKFNEEPLKASRPFDSRRAGYVPSEGTAVLILEELEHARSREAKIYAEILGYGMSGDGFHATSPPVDGNGAQRAMKAAMKDAGVQPEDVTHINAHATSTPLGDRAENFAIKQVFKEHAQNLLVYSAKGALGHTQGAAGAVESVITAMSISEGLVPPNLNLEVKEPEFDLNYPTGQPSQWAVEKGKRRIALSNSFGFGGANGVVCIAEFVP